MPVTEISKDEILEIALHEFLKNGIQAFTIKQLTELTGISTKTVYKLFADKTGLLRVCLNKHYQLLFDELLKISLNSKDAIESFSKVMHRIVALEFDVNPKFYAELNKYYPKLQDEIFEANDRMLSIFNDILQRGIQNGLFRQEVDPNVSWISFQRLYSGITRENVYGHLALSAPVLVKSTVFVFLRGMCTPTGVQKLEQYEQSTFQFS
ncbi:TetR/AcrR family transcriptional regulator [Ulvibacterium sp.]|uniref:TetR/AcrR family transcriptional regulator n=1 Tax=Ulvibacterium sp. TaxID=2665914 RepID=UPI002606581A|nr:TetR/AcrR family transcriptional regulator [Ulvibacterium sp.]